MSHVNEDTIYIDQEFGNENMYPVNGIEEQCINIDAEEDTNQKELIEQDLDSQPVDPQEDTFLHNIPEPEVIPSCLPFGEALFTLSVTEIREQTNRYKASAWIDRHFLDYRGISFMTHYYNKLIYKLDRVADKLFCKLYPNYLTGTISLEWKNFYGNPYEVSYRYEECPLTVKNYNKISKQLLKDAKKWYDDVYIKDYQEQLREWWSKKHPSYIFNKEGDILVSNGIPIKQDDIDASNKVKDIITTSINKPIDKELIS